jgi:hypothetical protein
MARSEGRLVPAPDAYSDSFEARAVGHQDKRNGPAVFLVLPTPGAGPGRHHTEDAKRRCRLMAKRTRTSGLSDSGTRDSAVKITPASNDRVTVPSTTSIA